MPAVPGARVAVPLLSAILALAVLVPAEPVAAAQPPRVERVWGGGGASGPYTLEGYVDPARGPGVIAVGYTGGARAVGREGVRWRWSDGSQVAEVATGDLTGDGVPEVIVGSYFTAVTVLDGTSGAVLAAFEVAYSPEGLAVGDATGDGTLDLYIVTSSPTGGTNTLTLIDGATLEEEWSLDLGYAEGIVMAAEAADLDGDGLADIVFGTRSSGPRVHAHAADGSVLWQRDLGGTINRLAIGGEGRTVFAAHGATLTALAGATGGTLWDLPGTSGFSQLASADLDGDGEDDAVWAAYGATGKSPTFVVTAVDGPTGRPRWVVPTLAPPKDLVTGDLTGDGLPDVAASTQDVNGTGPEQNFVWAIEGATGRPLWTHEERGERTTFFSDLALADVAGDARDEVIVSSYSHTLLGLRAVDGVETWRTGLGPSIGDAVVTNLDGTGPPESVEGGGDFHVVARSATTGQVRWRRDLGAEILALSALPSGSGADVLALANSSLSLLDGTDGAVRWSLPLDGLGAAMLTLEADGRTHVAVSSRLRRHSRGPGNNTLAGSLTLVDAETGLPRWTLRTPGVAWSLEAADLDSDGNAELVTGSPATQWGVAVYEGAGLATLPLLRWQVATGGGVGALRVTAGSIVTVQSSARNVVALDPADGAVRWVSEPHAGGVSSLGFEDVTGDGAPDALVGLDTFSDGIAAVDATDGDIVFSVSVGISFVKAARWTDLSGDGAADLLFASDGGTFGNGAVVALDGTTLDAPQPRSFWSYEGINAFDLDGVETAEALDGWLAWGGTTMPDALVLLQPFPEDPDEA